MANHTHPWWHNITTLRVIDEICPLWAAIVWFTHSVEQRDGVKEEGENEGSRPENFAALREL